MKTVEYTAKGYNGEKVDVPSKCARVAKGLVDDVIALEDEDNLPRILSNYGYKGQIGIFESAKELFSYKSTYNDFSSPSKELKMMELKDSLYLKVCMYGIDRINDKKTRKIKKKSEEEISKINKKNSQIKERIQKMLRDD
jgi:hypothetical protein